MSAIAFECEAVGRVWGTQRALEKLDLSIEAGQRVALVGPSGSGKTTLLRLLSGALRPTSGRVLVDGTDLARLGPRALRSVRGRLGFVHQGNALVPQLSVHANVAAGRLSTWPIWRTAWSFLWPIERARIAEILAAVGLADRQWDPTGTLSGGQQQRIAIARALVSPRDAILADEPTASLDPTTAREITELLLERALERDATLIFCTHAFHLVETHADRVIGLREGRVVLDASAEQIDASALEALYQGRDAPT